MVLLPVLSVCRALHLQATRSQNDRPSHKSHRLEVDAKRVPSVSGVDVLPGINLFLSKAKIFPHPKARQRAQCRRNAHSGTFNGSLSNAGKLCCRGSSVSRAWCPLYSSSLEPLSFTSAIPASSGSLDGNTGLPGVVYGHLLDCINIQNCSTVFALVTLFMRISATRFGNASRRHVLALSASSLVSSQYKCVIWRHKNTYLWPFFMVSLMFTSRSQLSPHLPARATQCLPTPGSDLLFSHPFSCEHGPSLPHGSNSSAPAPPR